MCCLRFQEENSNRNIRSLSTSSRNNSKDDQGPNTSTGNKLDKNVDSDEDDDEEALDMDEYEESGLLDAEDEVMFKRIVPFIR